MFKTEFRKAVKECLNATAPFDASRAKDGIITLVRRSTESDVREQIQEVFSEFGMLTEWLEDHFTPGSLYVDRNLVFGWWYEDQLQAEPLPVALSKNYFKGSPREMGVLADRNGFSRSLPLPLLDSSLLGVPGCLMVCVPASRSIEYARYGWAEALPLQWRRDWGRYIVDRSIIACGFWAAWKWWAGAGEFYAENPPYPMAEDFDYRGVPTGDS
jgi:hypothetical protein